MQMARRRKIALVVCLIGAGLILTASAGGPAMRQGIHEASTSYLHVESTELDSLSFSVIPGVDDQPVGPVHDFRITAYEITNEQFVAFLNDAKSNLTAPKGHYMYFDVDSGDVYIHSSTHGVIGTQGSGTKLFDTVANGHIIYSDNQFVLDDPAYADHPVAGVTWYGAIKFCNWLTLDIGLAPDDRAYAESPSSNLSGWRPVTISAADWSTRDLNDTERQNLLEYVGFRLPMDGQASGASLYNEWYKAAAFDGVGDTLYGFGRSIIENADANFFGSDDPFEAGTTPIGFFDGVNLLGDGSTVTRDTENRYNLYDMSGNVWEWMQDQSPTDPARRRNRGGSWRSSTFSLRANTAAHREAGSPSDATGFRIVQSVIDALLVTPYQDLSASGPWGGPYAVPDSDVKVYEIANIAEMPISFATSSDAPWVMLEDDRPDGVIPAGEGAMLTVTIDPLCEDGLHVGVNNAIITIENLTSQTLAATRDVILTVSEPLQLTPAGGFSATMPVGGTPDVESSTYTFTSLSDVVVAFTATWEETAGDSGLLWLTLNGGQQVDGEVPVGGTFDVAIAFDASEVANLTAGTYQAAVTFTDSCTGTAFVRTVSLEVISPFSVEPAEEQEFSGPFGGPFEPASHTYTITNEADSDVEFALSVIEPEVDWLDLSSTGQVIAPSQFVNVDINLTSAADLLGVGEYVATLRFAEPTSGFEIDRVVRLTVTELDVAPTDDVSFSGPQGGPFGPVEKVYTLTNHGPEMFWSVMFEDTTDQPPGVVWIDADPSEGTLLDPESSVDVTIFLTAEAYSLPTGTYTGTLTFLDVLTQARATRSVVFTVGGQGFALDMVNIPVDHEQPDGPAYLYRIGKFEVTNTAFVRFLNDINPDDNLTHDTVAGRVKLAGDGTTLFSYDPAGEGPIRYEDGFYTVEPGFWDYPVVGVSWYGAAKFCNWLTLLQGMSSNQRVYGEGPVAADWEVTLSNADVVAQKRGYRLPMDDGVEGASAQGEWYKAAAWLDVSSTNVVYGFGRDTISIADANYLDSADPFEPGCAPVGYYNGLNTLADPEAFTEDTGNGYGLYDMAGNVAEWTHDHSMPTGEAGIRGGHFQNIESSIFLRTDRRSSLPATGAYDFVGFRVSQAFEPVELEITPARHWRVDALLGEDLQDTTLQLTIHNPSDVAVDQLDISIDVPWLEIDGVSPTQIPPHEPGESLEVTLRFSAEVSTLGLSSVPPGGYALVRGYGSDVHPVLSDFLQPGGPTYDFWINKTEITNAEFVSFLTDVLSLAQAGSDHARAAYLYVDTATGSFFVNDSKTPGTGEVPPAPTIPIFDVAVGRIDFDSGAYSVEAGYADHPVVGVSWYGAVKYCNWLSLTIGTPELLLAYAESTVNDLPGWRPVDAMSWESGLFSAAERQAWVRGTMGYRLPMDDLSLAAADYNEWYKAAAWDYKELTNRDFGFGRDQAEPAAPDANFLSSGDTEEDGTTSIAFFDGENSLADGQTLTFDTDNVFGLYDLCGNVAEWTSELFTPDIAAPFTIRGGSFLDPAAGDSLRNNARDPVLPEDSNDHTGFRTVRGTGHIAKITITDAQSKKTYERFVILDLHPALAAGPQNDLPALSVVYGEGMIGHPEPAKRYLVENLSENSVDFAVSVAEIWIDLIEVGSQEPASQFLEGTLAGGESMEFDVQTNADAQTLAPGEYTSTVTIEDSTHSVTQTRELRADIGEPIEVNKLDADPQKFTGYFGGPFYAFDQTASRAFEYTNVSFMTLDYEVSLTATWMDLDGDDPINGSIASTEVIGPFDVSIAGEADSFAVGEYDINLSFQWTDTANGDLSRTIDTPLSLEVKEPVEVVPEEDEDGSWSATPGDQQIYTLTNRHASVAITVQITTDVDWLDLGSSEELLLANEQTDVNVSVNEIADTLYPDSYTGTITFLDTLTNVAIERSVELTVGASGTISVFPAESLEASGPAGVGPFYPASKAYELINREGGTALNWTAQTNPSVNWLMLNGANVAGGNLNSGESTTLWVAIDPIAAAALAEGEYQVAVEVSWDGENGDVSTRDVTLHVVTPQFVQEENAVPRSKVQPLGPAYSFVMVPTEVTNAEFHVFLNDALANPANERGEFMYFNTSSGVVYVGATREGASGEDVLTAVMFDPNETGHIYFQDGAYALLNGSVADLPVAGVSWYGAVKYCNWLTLDQGMLPGERCYHEATETTLTDWRPSSISEANWALRDLNDIERASLIAGYRGYRLPMDEGYNNISVNTDSADDYNEWYKAAAWSEDLGANTVFGFGRNTISAEDANYINSGDPYDNGPAPVAYYDGSDHGGTFATAGNENSFGLYDLSGNLYEWVQGRFNTNPNSIANRTIRGGSWNRPGSGWLGCEASFRTFAPAGFTSDEIGFRVVRIVKSDGDGDFDGDVDLDDFALMYDCLSGPNAVMGIGCNQFDFNGDISIDLLDLLFFVDLLAGG